MFGGVRQRESISKLLIQDKIESTYNLNPSACEAGSSTSNDRERDSCSSSGIDCHDLCPCRGLLAKVACLGLVLLARDVVGDGRVLGLALVLLLRDPQAHPDLVHLLSNVRKW